MSRLSVETVAWATRQSSCTALVRTNSLEKVCRGLKDVFCFYAVDLPGSGASPAPRDFHYTLEHFADVLTDFIVVKDLKKLTLVGHSLGGTIVLFAFLKNKDELAPDPVAMSYRRNRLPGGVSALYEHSENASFGLARAQHSGFCESFFTPFFVVVAFISAGECQRSIDRNSRLDKHSTLCALLTTYQNHSSTYSGDLGAEDNIVPLKLGKRLARELWRARLIVVDDCGHAPHEECTAEVTAALREFARTISQNTPVTTGCITATPKSAPTFRILPVRPWMLPTKRRIR